MIVKLQAKVQCMYGSIILVKPFDAYLPSVWDLFALGDKVTEKAVKRVYDETSDQLTVILSESSLFKTGIDAVRECYESFGWSEVCE